MVVKEMVQYKRTADMEELYLMLNNDSVAYDLGTMLQKSTP